MGLELNKPTRTTVITQPTPANPNASRRCGMATKHAYFSFRVWRRRRNSEFEKPMFFQMLPFLRGMSQEAWNPRYGLPFRVRLLGSMILHSRAADALRTCPRP